MAPFARRLLRLLCAAAVTVLPLLAQPGTAPTDGIRAAAPGVHALVNARIVTAPGTVIERGAVVIRDGRIAAVGAGVAIPEDAIIRDCDGLTIYPGLMDVYSDLGRSTAEDDGDDAAGTGHWNPKVNADRSLADDWSPAGKDRDALRKRGFTSAWVVPGTGIFAGSGMVVSLADGPLALTRIADQPAQHVRLGRAGSGYPSSEMGVIAMIRQTLMDTDWYRRAHRAYAANPAQAAPEQNAALAALAPVLDGERPLVFATRDDHDLLRALTLAREFGVRAWLKGSGMEYRQVDALKIAAVPVILPLDFPEKLAADGPEDVLDLELRDLQHWYLAPENPARLARAGVPILFTREGLEKKDDPFDRLRTAIERGLSPDAALAAMTTTPARLLGLEAELGRVATGLRAHLVVTDGDLFAADRHIHMVWIDGRPVVEDAPPATDPRGRWSARMTMPGRTLDGLTLTIAGAPGKLKGTLTTADSVAIAMAGVERDHERLFLRVAGDSLGMPGALLLSAAIGTDSLSGYGRLPDGGMFRWAAWGHVPDDPTDGKKADGGEWPEYTPHLAWSAYRSAAPPEAPRDVVVRDATIWTSGPRGILADADLHVRDGRIVAVGADLNVPSGAVEIDATGKHVTPGLIDAHSHTGIDGGVNEATQAATAEVRIGDVLDAYDISWYRQLAGGLTMANLLHGSANPIGGQNAVVKLRWGLPPEALKVDGAPAGIKFALGENPKQSNWGPQNTTRYPQTRMGVETFIRDRFRAALDYRETVRRYESLGRKDRERTVPPRRDLELETLLEILDGNRFIHSHSYRQDEILMLCRIAEEFGFTIGTFQHVLEGYKVAEAIRETAIGASSFSDWWAYKFEVFDAIPFNGALMHDVGVNVSFNSDSDELARRLNTEAAKAVRYGGVDPAEALKFVTLNPAIQLGLGDRVGSLEPGKDGDFVIWSGDPLSTYTRCEQTWIEGRAWFDRERDGHLREVVEAERSWLLQQYLARVDGTSTAIPFRIPEEPEYSCGHGGHGHD